MSRGVLPYRHLVFRCLPAHDPSAGALSLNDAFTHKELEACRVDPGDRVGQLDPRDVPQKI